jgi:hypothetical protein
MRARVLDLVSIGLCAAALAGCVTVSFKRGASPDAMAADERACRDATTGEAAYVDCMRERGWFMAGAAAAARPAETGAQAAHPAAGVEKSGVTIEYEPPRPAPTAPPAPADEAKPRPTPTASDPLARFTVASWWKLGGSAADLDRAIAKCVGELGELHRPPKGAAVVTAGLRDCLRRDGWYAVGVGPSSPG